jgi:AcrR family transcriptional regulator
MPNRPPLRERKQQRARERIVEAAFALFAERGFSEVTVTDIAERAEVGRTTFFRYFGDKQEVVFADEQQLRDGLEERERALPAKAPADLREALAQLQRLVVDLCIEVTRDTEHYLVHERLVAENPELYDRQVRKLQLYTEAGEDILRARGASAEMAALASQLALACYHAGRRVAGLTPEALVPAVRSAFAQLGALAGDP